MPYCCALLFVTPVTNGRCLVRARSNANLMIRSQPVSVNSADWTATSPPRPRAASARPPSPAYSPSLFSRTTTQSSSGPASRSGLGTPGRKRTGRTLAHWSRPWQIASRSPHRLTWSGTDGQPTAPK